MPACRSQSSSKASATAGCAAPTISAKASRPFTRSAGRNFAENDVRVDDVDERRREPRSGAHEPSYTGRAVRRFEDADLLRGHGRFGDDLPVRPDTLHAAILRSPHAHAEVLSG